MMLLQKYQKLVRTAIVPEMTAMPTAEKDARVAEPSPLPLLPLEEEEDSPELPTAFEY